MKRKMGGILIAIIAISAVFCGAFFSSNKTQQSSASYKQGFDYIGPKTDLASNYEGKVTLGYSGNTEQFLRITVRDENENIVHPVFSSEEMNLIATNKGAEVQYGFVELQPNHNVVVEIGNLTANRSTKYFLNHETESKTVLNAADDGYSALFNTAYLNKNTLHRNSSDTSLVGVFNAGNAKANEGYLHFNVDTLVFDKTLKNLKLDFGFYIVDQSSYNVKPHLRHGDYEIDGIGDEYFNWAQSGGQFYYSYFDGANPFIEYATKYFDVDIIESDLMKNLKRKFVLTDENNDLTRKTFAYLGEYTVTAWKGYYDEKWKDDEGNEGRWAYSHHNEHSFWLNVFGAQAYYENYNNENPAYSSDRELFFGGETDPGADFSEHDDIKAIPKSAVFSIDGAGGTRKVSEVTASLPPAITNSPPVKLYSNVLPLSSSQTFFNDGTGWKLSKFNPSAQYQAAGEYFIVNYYTYSVANPTDRDFTYRQVFYFRIDNSVSVKVFGKNNQTYYFLDEYVDRYAELTDGFAVFVHGLSNNEIGDYEVPASLTLTHYDWDGKSSNIPLVVEQNGRVTNLGEQTFDKDGKYVFEVRYGNRRVSKMDFTVVVDTTPAKLIITSESKPEHQRRSELTDFAIFGDGEVSVTIDAKKSGVGFSKYADISFYPFEYNDNYQQELDKTKTSLYSKYSLGGKNHNEADLIEPQSLTSSILATPTGWRLAETFTLGGIYQINLEDDAGNPSEFIFIIENTPASFGQTVPPVKSQSGKMNIVDQSVTISFGEYKLVHALPKYINLDNVFESAGFAEMYLNNAIYVQIIDREISQDNFVYKPATNLAQPGYCMDYTIDDLYFFRSIDALGNITPNYVWVNSDISQGMIIEDDTAIERNGRPSEVAALVRPKGMSNRQSLHFSFITKRDLAAPKFRSDVVESVEVRYYPFSYDSNPVSNKNYPFSSTYEESTIYDIGNNPDNPEEAYRDKIWVTTNVRDTAVEAETVYIPINQRSGVTAEGLYVIERTYESLTFNNDELNLGDSLNKTFFFIVDRNEVIPLNGVPFQSDVEIRFDNGKVANWNHFKSPIQSDSIAAISVPFCPNTSLPSKYGASLVLDKIHYKGVNDNQPKDQQLTMSGLALNVSLTKPNGDIVTDNNELYSPIVSDGDYRLTVADQSGGISLGFFGQTGLLMQSSGSVSTIDFSLNIHRANVTWVRNNKALSPGVSSTQFIKGNEIVSGDKLGIEFNNGPDYMHGDVHKLEIYRNGKLVQTEDIPFTPDINTFYYFDLTKHVQDCDEEIVAKLYYYSDEFQSDVYDFSVTMSIDNKAPTWNLRDKELSLQKIDTHFNKFSVANAPIISGNGNFVYAIDIDSEFAFQLKDENPHLDTDEYYHIQEVTSELLTNRLGFSGYYRYSNIAFSSIINLQPNENRYFRITETDQAGNESIYYVRIKGSQYPVDVFPVLGLSSGGNLLGASYSDENYEYVFGKNIRVGDFTAYWDANPTFVWSWKRTNDSSVGSEYRRIKNMAKTTVNTPTGAKTLVSDDSRSKFNDWVEDMLGGNIGQQIELTVNNGFHARTIRISQSNNTTAKINAEAQIDNSLKISVSNGFEIAQTFPGIRFYVSVSEIINGEVRNKITSDNDFSITTNPKVIDDGADKDYFIKITDSFGREVTYEYYHNGVLGNIIYNGSIKVLYGTRYVGHEDGVTIQYDPRVLKLEINDQTYNGISADKRITQITDSVTGFVTVHIKPDPNGDLSAWKVVLRYIISGNIANSGSWQFYNHMPTLSFHNKNGELITNHIESGLVPGEVVAKLSRAGYLFTSTVSYTVTLQDGTVLFEGVGRNTERIDLDYAGIYTITVTNLVSARKTYTFVITDVNNVDYRVFTYDNAVWVAVGQKEVGGSYFDRWFNEDGIEVEQGGVWKNGYYKNGSWRELQSSPETISYDTGSGVYGTINIPVYYIVSNTNDDININSTIWKMRIAPSISNERTLHRAGQLGTQNAYVYYLQSPHSDSRIYFVIARVSPTNNFLTLLREAPSTPLADIDWTIGSNIATYRSVAVPGVKVSISATSQTNVLASNVYYADYHYNGEYSGRFYFYHSAKANENFTFYAKDYGIYEFYLYDWAGNRQMFNGNTCFTIVNLARPPVLINGETLVDEMLYNSLDLSFITIPSFVSQSDTAMFVTSIYVERNGEPVFPSEEDGKPLYPVKADSSVGYFFEGEKRENQYIKHLRTNFSLSDNASGRYKIVIEYCNRINVGLTRQIVKNEFYVTYVNNTQYMHTFNYGGTTGIELVSIFQGNSNITGSFKTLPIQLNAGGTYEITLRVNNSIKNAFEVTRTVELSQLQIGNASNIVRANKAFGGTHKGGVTVSFNPRHISMMFTDDEAVLTILKNGQVVEKYHINSTDMLKENSEEGRVPVENIEISQHFADEGAYEIILKTSNGVCVFYNGFVVGSGMNPVILILLLVGVGVVIVAVIIFIRLRTGMRVR